VDVRLFIAVELPEDWIGAMTRTQAALRRRGLEQLRWVRPEGVHLTLKFLGNVDEQRGGELARAIELAAAGSAPFSLTLSGMGTFGPAARPRVLWAGVTGDVAALARLWQAVEAHIGPLGFPPERERFNPHLTLARVPDHLPREVAAAIAPTLAGMSPQRAAPLIVREIALIRSLLGPGGARYVRLASGPLTGKRTPIGHDPDPHRGAGVV